MTTLTLVPLNNTYVNPEEIAAIEPYMERCVIMLRGNQTAIAIDWTVEQVIERLKNHFEPTLPEEKRVVDAMNVLKNAAKSFPEDVNPIHLAAGIKDVYRLLEGPEKTLTNEKQ